MADLGIPEDVRRTVEERSGGYCECSSPKHRRGGYLRCKSTVGMTERDTHYVIYPIGRAPLARNVYLVCDECYQSCYGARKRFLAMFGK
jgi:hypothetical protein